MVVAGSMVVAYSCCLLFWERCGSWAPCSLDFARLLVPPAPHASPPPPLRSSQLGGSRHKSTLRYENGMAVVVGGEACEGHRQTRARQPICDFFWPDHCLVPPFPPAPPSSPQPAKGAGPSPGGFQVQVPPQPGSQGLPSPRTLPLIGRYAVCGQPVRGSLSALRHHAWLQGLLMQRWCVMRSHSVADVLRSGRGFRLRLPGQCSVQCGVGGLCNSVPNCSPPSLLGPQLPGIL